MVRELSSEKRERFLWAALKLFAANGVQNTSTAEIARAAGTASGTLFLYFPTKQALIDELAILISREESAHINRMLEPSMTARDAFYTIWTGSVRWLLENGDAYQFSQQIWDFGIDLRGRRRGNGEELSFLLRNHSKRICGRQHQDLSNRSDRRFSLSGHRCGDELPAHAARVQVSRKHPSNKGLKYFGMGSASRKRRRIK